MSAANDPAWRAASGGCRPGGLNVARVAGLPMYELEALRPAYDRLWQGLRAMFEAAGLDDVPPRLDRSLSMEQLWTHPDLLLGQTCGYPLTHALGGRVRLVATPCYRAGSASGAEYASLIFARADDPRRRLLDFRADGRLALNGIDSHSGHHALRAALAAIASGPWFASATITGSHIASLEVVRRGAADVAAIDGVIVALLERHAPGALEGLRLLGVSPPAPGLPLITSKRTRDDELDRLRQGLGAALAEPTLADAWQDLLIDGIRVLPLEAYERILELERRGSSVSLPPACPASP